MNMMAVVTSCVARLRMAVAGQSRRSVRFINAAGNTVREEEYALLSDGSTWALLSGAVHSYDACSSDPIWEIDEDGVRTDYAYDSTRQLIEITRAEVRDADRLQCRWQHGAAGRHRPSLPNLL